MSWMQRQRFIQAGDEKTNIPRIKAYSWYVLMLFSNYHYLHVLSPFLRVSSCRYQPFLLTMSTVLATQNSKYKTSCSHCLKKEQQSFFLHILKQMVLSVPPLTSLSHHCYSQTDIHRGSNFYPNIQGCICKVGSFHVATNSESTLQFVPPSSTKRTLLLALFLGCRPGMQDRWVVHSQYLT